MINRSGRGGTGRWQRRILQTLAEAQGVLTVRQLGIRCGVGVGFAPTVNTLRQKDAFRQCLSYLAREGFCRRVAHGAYALPSAMST
mgnify:FL=1